MRRRLSLLALVLGLLVPGAAMAASPGVDASPPDATTPSPATSPSPAISSSPAVSPSPDVDTSPVAAIAPLPTPVAGRAVYDAAGIWTADTIEEAERILSALREDTGTQTAVVSLATGLETVSEAQAIGDAALIMRRFGVGTQGRNDGLVVLFDLDTTLRHGQIRIYPGYDLEAAGLPPDVAQSIFDLQMAPLAVGGDLDGSLLAGLRALDATLRDAAGVGAGTGAGTGTGPETAWTPGPDEPVVYEDPGLPAFGGPSPDAGGGFIVLVVLIGIAGVGLSLLTGIGRGGGGGSDASYRAWLFRNHDDRGPRMGGGSWGGGGGGDSGGGGGFGGGGDSGGSGGGGGGF